MRMMSSTRLQVVLAVALVIALLFHSINSRANDMTPTNQFFDSGPQAALEMAIRADDGAGVAAALAHGASANATGKFNITPLMVAVDVQSLQSVRVLLKAGALPNALAQDGNGPVSLAVKSYLAKPHGREIMTAIFKGGGNPDARQPDGDPVLMRFIYDRDVADLKVMKELGANLDIRDRTGDPLVTSVAMAQDWDMAWALIELGAAYDYEGGKSRRPLSLALKGPYPAPDSPLYPFKVKVWQLLKDKGLPVLPLTR